MYIIIAGGGLVGKGLAQKLVENKHDVVVIDGNQSVCEQIYAEYGAVSVHGNATHLNVLESARMDQCDVAVAAMRNDPDNLTFALLAKHFNVPQILVRMRDPNYESIYKSVGVTQIARAISLMIDQLMVNIESPELRKVIGIGELEICIINVPENARTAGKTVANLTKEKGFPADIIVTSIFQDEKEAFVIPHGNTVVNAKDRLFLCGTRKDIKAAASIITKS